uniref:C-type lectin domain-containing protein n=1 Tax=Anopheles dirus TaxID=7168 RepID=A0A182NPW9_9DIPT
MRPENSARFTWTSSKALDPASGYWAEAIPAMEQPLCAVVDPVRDFRWHALRCGGPETAAFLCELPVPSWAVDCTITSIPSLTVQYMSDSGTVQLSRDCGESGTKHISCQGKQDRDSIVEQLQCSEEEDLASVLATENNNQLQLAPGAEGVGTASSTRRPQPLPILEHDILTVVSSNDEEGSNKIEVNPNQIEDTVKNVINKFNLQDLMRSEQAALHSDEADGVGHGAAGSSRKAGFAKKYSPLYEKKSRYAKKLPERNESGADDDEDDDEPMLGDQPMQDETETQPIDIIQQAVKPTADGDYADATLVAGGVKSQPDEGGNGGTDGVTTPDSRLRRGTDADGDDNGSARTTEMLAPSSTAAELTEATTPAVTPAASTTSTTTAASGPPALLTTRTTVASHILPTTPKKEVITGDHFIPPMLLVKARFISARPHTEPPPTTMLAPTASSTTNLPTVEPAVTEPSPTSPAPQDVSAGSDPTQLSATVQTSTASEENAVTAGSPADVHQVVDVVFDQTKPPGVDQVGASLTITTRPFTATESDTAQKEKEGADPPQVAALVSTIQLTQYSDLNTTTASTAPVTTVQVTESSKEASVDGDTHTTDGAGATSALPASDGQTTTIVPSPTSVTSTEVPERVLSTVVSSEPARAVTQRDVHTPFKDELFAVSVASTTTTPTGTSTEQHASVTPANAKVTPDDPHQSAEEHAEEEDDAEHSELHNSFSNVENYQPYKPNRHRTLTKPEVHNNHGAYIKKILG